MKKIIISILLSTVATAAHADDYWSGFLDVNTAFQRDNHYTGDTRWLESNQWRREATAEVQYRWNACALGARLTYSAANYEYTTVSTGAETESDADAYGIGAQAGCNVRGLWLVGFGGIEKTDLSDSSITDYRETTFGAGLYFQQMERLGYGIAVSRLNTQYTWTTYNPFSVNFDADLVEGKLDFFINPNLLSSTTISYLGTDDAGTGSLFTRLEFKPETMNFAVYAGIGGSITDVDDPNDNVQSYTAKVGLRWYFANDSLQAMHNNQMPTFD